VLAISHLKRKIRTRGAVLVEAVVVVPVFIILLAGMIFLHELLSDTLRTMRAARNDAWTLAMQSCAGGGGGPSELMKLNSQMPGAPGSDQSLRNSSGASEATSSAAVHVSNGEVGFAQAVSSGARVWCNDQTAPGNVVGVFQWLLATGRSSLR
jgi:hypothetical protein